MAINYEKKIQSEINRYEKLIASKQKSLDALQKELLEYQNKLKEWKELSAALNKFDSKFASLTLPINETVKVEKETIEPTDKNQDYQERPVYRESHY